MKQVNFKIVLCGILIGLTGCASQPKPIAPIVGAAKIEKMERREVIQAVADCEDEGMRPYVNYVTQRTDYGKVLVPIDVYCMPKRK